MRIIIYIFQVICLLLVAIPLNASEATINVGQTGKSTSWTLENDAVKFLICYEADKGITLSEFYNKNANQQVTGTGNLLFDYQGRYIPTTKGLNSVPFHYTANDSGWSFQGSQIETIKMSTALSNQTVGKKLTVKLSKEQMQVSLIFSIYDGNAGLRYQTYIKNLSATNQLLIEHSNVITLDFPNDAHHLHYVLNSKWLSTTGNMEEPSTTNKADDVAKCYICLYDNGTGWYVAPETNWKTQYGPEVNGKKETPSYYYQLRPFAHMSAWTQSGNGKVSVSTSPESLQLNLFPGEEFEYIAVNLTAFKGDILDGKMAVEEHLRKRFHFHDTSTSMMINDWEWFRNGYRTEDYLVNTVLPKAQKADYDILLIDDGWNNSTSDGKWITEDSLSRDPIESNTPGIPDMAEFAGKVKEAGLRLGLWYSNSGGGHNNGNDLADPKVIEAKKGKIETMISNYSLSHQAVDLTQYWQNLDETAYSHPSDNVYRKNVLARNMMNAIVDTNPSYEFKVTSELDLYPNPGNRMTELMHLPNNGWMTITGASKPIDNMGIYFGHLPLNAIYLGSGADPATTTDVLYAALSGRDVKAYTFPNNWDNKGIWLLGKLNRWRKNPRVKALTSQIVHPLWLGKGCTEADASQWQTEVGPYVWMYMNDDDKTKAFVIATSGGHSVDAKKANYPTRWLDNDRQYIIEDVTLDDTGVFTYVYKGKMSGKELNETGLTVDLSENTSAAKAFWLVADENKSRQVIFADENVSQYTETQEDNKLIIQALGKADSTGVFIISGDNTAMSCPVTFDDEGKATLVINEITNNDVSYPGKQPKTVRLEFEDYNSTVEKSSTNIKMNRFDNGNPDSEHGYSSVAIMTKVGDYVIYTMPGITSGRYQISLNYKLSRTKRGNAQFYLVNANGSQTALGTSIDESTTGSEKMQTVDLGTYDIAESDTLKIKMELVGGGNSGSGTYIGANYIKFIPVNGD